MEKMIAGVGGIFPPMLCGGEREPVLSSPRKAGIVNDAQPALAQSSLCVTVTLGYMDAFPVYVEIEAYCD